VWEAIEESRAIVADILLANPSEIIFTSGGTESDNLALIGIAEANKSSGKHIISVATEHHAVRETLAYLEKRGFEVSFIPVGSDGLVDLEEFKKLLRQDTILVSVMYVNNEIGTIQPISEIGKIISQFRKINNRPTPFFHTDACQAGYLSLDVQKLHVDALTLCGSKLYGPKGSGILYVKKDVKIDSVLHGGTHENGRRAGTENVPAIIGFAEALRLMQENSNHAQKKIFFRAKYFIKKIKHHFPDAILHGLPIDNESRMPGIINLAFPNFEAEQLLIYLSKYGIMCSAGSACSFRSNESSHVLQAIGLSKKEIKSSIRFSFGEKTSKRELDYIVKSLIIIFKILTF
jgi:cysteine desulfurase